MTTEIKIGTLKDIEDFLLVAKEVYRNDPIWIPEQRDHIAQNMRGRFQIVLGYVDERPVARAVAILNEKEGSKLGWIGMFECVEEHQDVGRKVLSRAENLLLEEGATWVSAPRVDNMVVGIQIEGFDQPQTVGTPHNPPYYLDIFLNSGYKISKRTFAYWIDDSVFNLPHVEPPPGFIVREFDRSSLEREIKIFNALNRAAFSHFPNYVPRSLEEERAYVQVFLPFLDDNLVIIAETDNGEPAGFFVCLPDVYQMMKASPIDRIRVVSIAVHPKYQRSKLGSAMISRLIQNVKEKTSFRRAEVSWIYEDNIAPLTLIEKFGAEKGRVFAILDKKL